MKEIVPWISPLIESQFPSFYREEGPQFIAFVKAYYEWLESPGNVLYHARRLSQYRDVDETIDQFILYFKEEILKNIQFDVKTNRELLIKNALDLYRARGTERAIDLFFKLVFGVPARTHYPADDIFKLSDNSWKIPTYLEVSETQFNPEYEGKQIRGLTSGATAFVESYSIKKIVNDRIDSSGQKIKTSKDVHVFFITNLKGTFTTGEVILHSGTIDPRNSCKIVGSLTNLSVIAGGADYKIGDIVKLVSNTGINGKAIVTNIINTTGQVEFNFIEGGWGYTTTPNIIISDKTIILSNVNISNTEISKPFVIFESLIQPKANIIFQNYNGTFTNNQLIYNYYANGSLSGYGKIISIDVDKTNANGQVYISIISGNIQSTSNLYSSANISSFEIDVYSDKTSTANIMGISTNNTLQITDLKFNRVPVVGEIIYQSNDSVSTWVTATVSNVISSGETFYISVSNTQGNFINGERIYGTASLSNSSLIGYNTAIGVYGVSERTIVSVTVENGGEGYKNNESVVFSSTTGFGAEGKVITNGSGNIVSIQVTRGGTNYLTAPEVFVKNSATNFSFNASTDVDEIDNFIRIPDNDFLNAQAIRYTVTSSNTSLNGLISNNVYYARFANSLGIRLSTSPYGEVISLNKGKSETGHSFAVVVSGGQYSSLKAVLGSTFDYENETYVYGSQTNTIAQIEFAGEGTLANFQILGLDDQQTVPLNTDFLYSNNIYGANYLNITLDGNDNSSLAGSPAFGFPKNPNGNLINGSIESMLSYDNFTIGQISGITAQNPGDDYTLDPFVAILEPIVYGYKKNDYIMELLGFSANFTLNENVSIRTRKKFNANLSVDEIDDFIFIENNPFPVGTSLIYLVDTGNTAIGGLSNNRTYFASFSNSSGVKLSSIPGGSTISLTKTINENGHYLLQTNYINFGIVTDRVDENKIKVKRTTIDKHIEEYADTYIKGETSQYVTIVVNCEKDIKVSGFNAHVEANVLTSNGYVKGLKVINSGFGYDQADVSSFYKIDDIESKRGLVKISLENEGKGDGFYKNTKSFLSYDKFLQDNDYYQDYSYELISSIPYEKYSEMLKKLLHISGTKVFPRTEITNIGSLQTSPISALNIRKTFNPSISVIEATNFISLDNEILSNTIFFNSNSNISSCTNFISISGANNSGYKVNSIVKYVVSYGNTSLSALSPDSYYYITYANSSGISISETLSGANIQLVEGLSENGHSFSLVNYFFSNGDLIIYNVDQGNTVIPGIQVYFNPFENLTVDKSYFNAEINIDENKDFISISGHNFKQNQPVRYIAEDGNTAINPLSNNKIYYTIFANTAGIIISNFKGGEPIKLLKGLSENGHSFSTFNDFINSPGHSFTNGSLITYTVNTGNLDIIGLSNNSNYYIAQANALGFKLSTTANGSNIITYNVSSPYRIKNVNIVRKGKRYNSTVNNKLIFIGNNEESAEAIFANDINGRITSVTVTNSGKGYADIPIVTVNSQANGRNAALSAVFADDLPDENGHYIKLQVINNYSYYVAYANSTGLKLSLTANGSSIVDLNNPPNQVGHGIYKSI